MAKVEIYTKLGCPHCRAAKKLLTEKEVEFTEIDLLAEPQRRDEMLARAEGRTTVPEIFIDDVLIGGNDDLQAKEQAGELDQLLNN